MSKNDRPNDGPKSSRKLPLALGAVALLGLGAGGAYGAVRLGFAGAAPHAVQAQGPRLILKGESDPYAPETGEGEGGDMVHGEGGSRYRTLYYSFEDGFTSNLKDSPGLLQVSLAASTHRDGRVFQWLKSHELAIRSAILVELADTPEDDVYSVEGKARLQKRLTKAINDVLAENEGFGGVDSVLFKSFLVQ